MLRTLVLAAAIVASSSTALASTLDLDGGEPRTARALRTAIGRTPPSGLVWLGKLRGVGGGRDTIVYVPTALDPARTIDVVVYMDGIGSFDAADMRTRHVAAMKRLRGNSIYVSPDSPSSSLGERASNNEHWQAGCADVACEGGHAAPGDFLVFLDEVRTKVASARGTNRADLDLRVSLIGFSRGGKGVLRALEQLEVARFVVGGFPVRIADVIFADGNYLDDALVTSWRVLERRPEAPRMTILVGAGDFVDIGGDGNRRRALEFWKWAAPEAPLPTKHRAVSAPRLRLIPIPGGHHAIGDAAVDYLASAEPMTRVLTA